MRAAGRPDEHIARPQIAVVDRERQRASVEDIRRGGEIGNERTQRCDLVVLEASRLASEKRGAFVQECGERRGQRHGGDDGTAERTQLVKSAEALTLKLAISLGGSHPCVDILGSGKRLACERLHEEEAARRIYREHRR